LAAISKHCTSYQGEMSTLVEISASIIQGSAIDPVTYVVSAGDLAVSTLGNYLGASTPMTCTSL